MQKFLVLLVVCSLSWLANGNTMSEPGWPKVIEKDGSVVTIYQPQIESFTQNKLEARAAVSVKTSKTKAPVFGAMWFHCRVKTDYETRLVDIVEIHIDEVKASGGDSTKVEAFKRALEKELNGNNMSISLDRLLADLDETKTQIELASNLNNDAPKIYYSKTSAVLVLIDGEPVLRDAENTKLQYVLNTPFVIIYDPGSTTYYLKGGNFWYSSKTVEKDWKNIKNPPKKVLELAATATEATDEEEGTADEPPVIYTSLEAAELIITDGEPDFRPVEGTQLLYVQNTESDIIMDIDNQQYYILLAGRWYASKALDSRNWKYVSQEALPSDFAQIPTDSELADIRSSVAGTQEAKEAALENQIPQTAEVEISKATLTVDYDGDPDFKKIEGTAMSYAVNTDKSVLLIKNKYYCCDEAVWFKANRATGPWQVATSVPDEVSQLPPDCPVYNVKYVYIYESTPDVVYVGYTPGYTWSYVHYGCVVYGTGYYYRPWYGHYYYPRPVTYGFGVHYNPYTGWGFSVGVSYGWFNVGWGAPYPYGWWGPGGYRYGYRHGYHQGYHHGYRQGARAGYAAGYRAGRRHDLSNNIYRNRPNGVRNTGVNRTMPSGGRNTSARNRDNNVLTDRNGNVYKRDKTGSWQQNNNGKWESPISSTRESGRQNSGTRESRPNTGTRESRPNTNTREARPNTTTKESRPKTSTREARPTQRPSTGAARPATRQSNGNYNPNRDYNSRQRGTQRSQQFNGGAANRMRSGSMPARGGGGVRRR